MTSAPSAAERHTASVRRTAFLNLLLASLLIAAADEPLVTMLIGGATVLLAALTGLCTAFRLTSQACGAPSASRCSRPRSR